MTTALVVNEQEAKTLSKRIGLVIPGMAGVSAEVRLAIAQLSLIHGLDPFMGEIMAIKQKGGGYVPYVGIEGTRRASRNQITYQRVLVPLNDYWSDHYYHMTAEEVRQANQMHEQDVVWLCAIYVDGQDRPYVELGVCGPGFNSVSQAPRWKIAKKRAEAAALKAACDLPFNVGEYGAEAEDDVVEGEVIAAPEVDEEAEFLAAVCEDIPYYSHPNHVRNTIAKLGLDFDIETAEKVAALMGVLNDYAKKRADENAAQNGGQAALPEPEEAEEIPW